MCASNEFNGAKHFVFKLIINLKLLTKFQLIHSQSVAFQGQVQLQMKMETNRNGISLLAHEIDLMWLTSIFSLNLS